MTTPLLEHSRGLWFLTGVALVGLTTGENSRGSGSRGLIHRFVYDNLDKRIGNAHTSNTMKRVLYITIAIAISGGVAFTIMNHGTTKAEGETTTPAAPAITAPAEPTVTPEATIQPAAAAADQPTGATPVTTPAPTETPAAPAAVENPAATQPSIDTEQCSNSSHTCFTIVPDGAETPN